MKQKLLLALLALFTGVGNLSAQTDVTDQYITNAGFDNCTAETSDVAAKTIKDYSSNGWTKVNSGDYTTIAVTAYGGAKVGGSSTPSTKKDGTTVSGNTLGIIAGWADNVTIQSGEITLPAGVYTLTVDHYLTSSTDNYGSNSSKFGFVTSSNSYLVSSTTFSASTWTTETVTFTLSESTTGKIQIGLLGLNKSGSGSPAVFYDDVTITWTDPLQAAKDALQAEIEKATSYNTELQNSDLTQAIATAQETKNIATTETELATAIETLKAAVITALTETDGAVTTTTDLFVVNPSFETGLLSPWTANNANDTGVKPNSNGTYTTNGVDGDYLFNTWGGTAEKYVKQTLTGLPEGYYTITASVASDAGNKVTLFAGSAQVEQEVSADGKGQFVDGTTPKTYVAADGSLEIGAKSTNWYKVDNFRLTYYTVTAGARDAWLAAKAAAEAARDDAAYVNVTGAEKDALLEEIAKEEPTTAEEYGAATTALQEATAAFTNAKTNYDAFVAAQAIETPELKYASNDKKIALNDAKTATATSATDADTKTAAIITALRAYYESHALAEGVEDAVNMTAKIANATDPTNNDGWTWTGNKNNPASNEPWTDADGTSNHSYFDGGNWSANSWTTTMKQTVTVPAGKYLLTAKARAAAGVTFTMAVGEASVNLPHVGSTGNVFDRGWGDASVEFETDGNPAEILVSASTSTQYEWFSISDFRLVQLEAIEVPVADAADYAALAAAISAAEANTLGFDEGEYAPYNNVAALQALAAAKAINPEAEDGNTKELVNNVTTALTAATWTANTEEVNAVHNGMFATVQEGANYPEGWNRTNAWGQMQSNIAGDYATAYYNQPGSLKYGESGVYTMPLKANTAYRVTFAYRSHENNSNNGVTVSVLNGEEGLSSKVFAGNGSTSEWKTGTAVFTTGAAGNYVLTLANNGNTWMTNVSIFRAVAEEVTLDDAATEAPAATDFANVTYNRTLTAGFNSLVLPFEVKKEEIGGDKVEAIYAYNGCTVTGEGADAVYHLDFQKDVETLAANTPYLVKMTEAFALTSFNGKDINPVDEPRVEKDNFSFVGSYIALPAGNDVVKAGDYGCTTSGLKKAKDGIAMKAFRAYMKNMTGNTEAKVNVTIDGQETDAITAVELFETMTEGVFNLQGQKVNKAQRGVYIVNGKKVVIK